MLRVHSDGLFPAEIGGNLSPFQCLPFHDGHLDVVCAEPKFSTGNDVEETSGLLVARQGGLAFLLRYPEYGIVTVGIDGLSDSFSLHERQGMDDGEELSDVVGAVNRTEMEDLSASSQVDSAIFHTAWVAGACRVYRPRIGTHPHGKGEHRIIAVGRWVLWEFFLGHGNRAVVVLHPLGHLDAQQTHAVADNLRHVGSKYQAHLFLCLGVGIEDAVVVVELVELLGEFIAVVGDAAG